MVIIYYDPSTLFCFLDLCERKNKSERQREMQTYHPGNRLFTKINNENYLP